VRKILVLLFFVSVLSGCATYKFQKSASSGSQGYLVSYDGKPILEYTVGKEKSLPDLTLAKERFKRRRTTVEYYCKKTGQIQSRLKDFFWDPPVMFVDFLWGVLRWPFIAVADYKYNRNPKYRARVDKLDEQGYALEKSRVDSLKEKLNAYIKEDLASEHLPQGAALPAAPEVAPQTPAPVVAEVKGPAEVKPVSVEEKPAAKPSLEPPVAVIIAKPVRGYSPLKVNFSGQKSYSKSGRIVSYDWDLGDGDTSTKKNPENTYWSTTYGLRNFTATLTVRDDAGNTSSVSTVIEVSTH
jgi:hypothetical protein